MRVGLAWSSLTTPRSAVCALAGATRDLGGLAEIRLGRPDVALGGLDLPAEAIHPLTDLDFLLAHEVADPVLGGAAWDGHEHDRHQHGQFCHPKHRILLLQGLTAIEASARSATSRPARNLAYSGSNRPYRRGHAAEGG